MLNLFDEYGARAVAPSSGYPTGSMVNETAPGASDGTPLDKNWTNDVYGALGAIIKAAGLTISDAVETADASQFLEGIFKLTQRKNYLINGSFQICQEDDPASISLVTGNGFANANYIADNLLGWGDGGSNNILAERVIAVSAAGNQVSRIELKGNQSDNTNMFIGMTIPFGKVGGGKVSFSGTFINNSGASSFDPLLTVQFVNGSRTVLSTLLSSQNIGSVPGDGAEYRLSHTFTMPNDDTVFGGFLLVSLQLPGRDMTTDKISLQEFQFEKSDFPTPFQPITFQEELKRCQLLYEKSADPDTPILTVTNVGAVVSTGNGNGTHNIMDSWCYQTPKVKLPTLTCWSPTTGNTGQVRDTTNNTDINVSVENAGIHVGALKRSSGFWNGELIFCQYIADARL